jgi:hypothetical protein
MSLAPCRLSRCRGACEMHSPAHFHKGVTSTVHEILPFITRLLSFCLQSLYHRLVDWTKPSNTALLLGTLTDLARSKSELVAENALLRKPLMILRRHIKRPVCTKTDRMLLVLLEVQIQSSCSQIKDIRRDRGFNQGNGQRQPTVGSRADSW